MGFDGEKVRQSYHVSAPEMLTCSAADGYRLIELPALVTMKLTWFRDKDRTHLRDMIETGLLDQSWLAKLPGELAERLQELLDNPDD